MRAYRLVPAARAATAFSGEGGLFAEGRWHRRGQRIVYASLSEAAARLEVLAHAASPDLLPSHVRIAAEIPDDVVQQSIDLRSLPPGWDAPPPYLDAVQQLGDDWLGAKAALVLLVPSALSPTDQHVLLNPQHPDMARVIVGAAEPCSFDARLSSLRR